MPPWVFSYVSVLDSLFHLPTGIIAYAFSDCKIRICCFFILKFEKGGQILKGG
ncbi:hypothetical protein CLS_21750 [[Clostridium] cf. saccharolyticum K10]|nr:hypothetical protein CLS_21750 [[Clostridium] cf. saccharolyticum K10]